MKVVILAGGLGSRISEESQIKPKPLIEIGGKPILWHIMKIYSHYKLNEFIVCCGYKGYLIKEYFANYSLHTTDITVDVSKNKILVHRKKTEPWKITLIDTGDNSPTGERVKMIRKYVGDTFCLTYGDGLSNVDLNKLIEFHKSHGKIATMSAVRPVAKFGELIINEQGEVESFKEKPQLEQGWINGGFFIFEPEIFDYLGGDEIMLEREPLEKLVINNQLMSYKHDGFWKCMDTKRDHEQFEKMYSEGNTPWIRKY